MTFQLTKWVIAVLVFAFTNSVLAYSAEQEKNCSSDHQRYVFSWAIGSECNNAPRGGSSRGASVTLDTEPHSGWLAIQQQGLSSFEKDRRAILAMAGPYKVSFDFLETVGFSKQFKRDRPYQSWGTEYVYVLEEREDFISLQHLMVMYFEQEDGSVSAPMVMKHWRQDWTYEDDELLVFDHRNQWSKQRVSRKERSGKWSQAVFQVDDSPRYESIGRWQHNTSFSSWISDTTRRPLPRREHSIRSDYQVLEGFNRHTITRNGWVQEEENWKLVVDETGEPAVEEPYLSKEEGLARYQRITDFDFSAGDQYMSLAGQFWADVREEWLQVFESHDSLRLHEKVNGQPIFMPLFQYAQQVMEEGKYDSSTGKSFAKETINTYVMK